MEKYQVGYDWRDGKAVLRTLTVERETAQFYVIATPDSRRKERRIPKNGWFDTPQEAKSAEIVQRLQAVTAAEERLKEQRDRLAQAEALEV